MKKGSAQLTDTMDLTPKQIADVYNITEEEASTVKNAIQFTAGSAFAGFLTKSIKGGIDLGVSTDDINKLKNKDNWTAEQIKQANIKKQNLQKAAEDGKLIINSKHGVTTAERKAITTKYRKDLKARINSLYINNPTAKQNALDKLEKSDIDHMIDLQLGGENTRENLKALDASVNRSYGKQLDNILKELVKKE